MKTPRTLYLNTAQNRPISSYPLFKQYLRRLNPPIKSLFLLSATIVIKLLDDKYAMCGRITDLYPRNGLSLNFERDNGEEMIIGFSVIERITIINVLKSESKDENNPLVVFANANTGRGKGNRSVTVCGKLHPAGNNLGGGSHYIRVGYSICHPDDEFDWSLAKKIAQNRATKEHEIMQITIRQTGQNKNKEAFRDQIYQLLKAQAEFMLVNPDEFIK